MGYIDRQVRKRLYEYKVNNLKNSNNKKALTEESEVTTDNIYQVTYSTDGVNYHSNVLVKAKSEDDAKQKAISNAKVKPHADSLIIITKRDLLFVDDWHGKRGMSLIESLSEYTLSKDAIQAVKRELEVGLMLANRYMTLHELDKLISSLLELRQSIVDYSDFLTEDYDGLMPPAPDGDELSGVSSMINSLIADELEAIDGYNGAIQTIKSLLTLDNDVVNSIIDILTDIAGEENVHVGQLQKAQELVNPQVKLAKEGEKEAEEVINGETSSELE